MQSLQCHSSVDIVRYFHRLHRLMTVDRWSRGIRLQRR